MEELETEFKELKKKVEALDKKDIWDKVKIITGILLPLAIVYVGHAFSASQSALQRELDAKQFEYQKQISTINSKVGQVGLVSNFFDALLSEDPVRKKLAIKAVLIALKEEGPELVKIVEESDNENDIKSFAKATLETKRNELVESLYSEKQEERQNAFNDIVTGWKNDTKMVKTIVEYGNSHLSNKDGVYNSILALGLMNKKTLTAYNKEIKTFTSEAERNGAKTKYQAEKLKTRL